MIALAKVAPTDDYRAKACSVRSFSQHGKISGAWLQWDGSILKARSGDSRGQEIDFTEMLSQLKSGLESTPIRFNEPKVKVIALLPKVRRCDALVIKLLRASGMLPEISALELSCIKRAEYDSFNQVLVPGGYPAVQENPSATTLVLMPQNEQITAIIQAHLLELIRISTGRITLIG